MSPSSRSRRRFAVAAALLALPILAAVTSPQRPAAAPVPFVQPGGDKTSTQLYLDVRFDRLLACTLIELAK